MAQSRYALIIARGAYREAARLYPEDLIELRLLLEHKYKSLLRHLPLARAGWLPEKKDARPRTHPGASQVTIGPPPMGGAVIMSLVESRRKLV
jgi:hypothetical protein